MTSEDGATGDAGDEPTTEPDDGGERVEPDDGERDNLDDGDASHLDDIEDGAGCAEIWERLSERRGE